LEVVEQIAERFAPVDLALLSAGGARTRRRGGYLTLTSDQAARAAGILSARTVIPCIPKAVRTSPRALWGHRRIHGELAKLGVTIPPSHRRTACSREHADTPGSLDELWGKALYPSVDGHVISGDAALGKQLLGIPVGQAISQVPADRDRDHLPREPETGEDRGRTRRAHRTSLQPAAIG
jgi:hypothetical protein